MSKLSLILKCTLTTILLLLVGAVSTIDIKALEFTALANPTSGTLAGASIGNISSFVTKIDLSSFYAQAIVSQALCTITQETAATAGTLTIYDNYSDKSLINLPLKTAAGAIPFDCTAEVREWLLDTSHNTGLLVKGTDLAAAESTNFDSISVTMQFTLPDTTAPELLAVPESQKLSDTKYRITGQANEPITSVLNYGKTSNYGATLEQTILGTDISYDVSELQEGVTYHYRLILTDAAGNITTTPDYTFTVLPLSVTPTVGSSTAIAALTIDLNLGKISELKALLIEENASNSIKLTWTELNDSSITGYCLSRKLVMDSSYIELACTSNTTFTLIDADVVAGNQYQYQIRAITQTTKSQATVSNEIGIPATSGVVAVTSTGTNINTWLIMGIAAALILFIGYNIFKFWKKLKSLFHSKNEKKSLKNVFRDPDIVD